MRKNIIIFLLISVFSIFIAYAKWNIITLKNNYPVWSINEDKSGNIWVAQEHIGLYKFTGENWRLYNNNLDLFPIIYSLEIDSLGDIWLGGDGLYSFDSSMVWKNYNNDLPKGFSKIRGIAIDKNNNKWIGTSKKGLLKYDGQKFIVYDTTNSPIPNMAINDVKIDRKGNIWFLSAITSWQSKNIGALIKFNGKDFTIYSNKNSKFPFARPTRIAIDTTGNIWVGCYGYKYGLAKFDGENWIDYEKEFSNLHWNVSVLSLAVDKLNNLWIGTDQCGLIKFDGENWIKYTTDNSELPGNDVFCIFADKNNRKWIGTDGLAVFEEEPTNIIDNQLLNITMSIIPNPVYRKLRINFNYTNINLAEINISNILGVVLKSEKINNNIVHNDYLEFDVSDLPSGIYFATMKTKDEVITKQFVILK